MARKLTEDKAHAMREMPEATMSRLRLDEEKCGDTLDLRFRQGVVGLFHKLVTGTSLENYNRLRLRESTTNSINLCYVLHR